jgi:hypothetical protein
LAVWSKVLMEDESWLSKSSRCDEEPLGREVLRFFDSPAEVVIMLLFEAAVVLRTLFANSTSETILLNVFVLSLTLIFSCRAFSAIRYADDEASAEDKEFSLSSLTDAFLEELFVEVNEVVDEEFLRVIMMLFLVGKGGWCR